MVDAVQRIDDDSLDDIGDEVAVPEKVGIDSCHEPKNRNHRERQGEGDKQGHAMLIIQLVNNHDDIDVTERNEAQSEYAQGFFTFQNHLGLAGSK